MSDEYYEISMEQTELEKSGLNPEELEFLNYEERIIVLLESGLDPQKYDF